MNNKLFVILISFLLLFTLNLSLNNSHASLIPIYQLPITISNSQDISTPNPFQQLIKINLQTINNDLSSMNVKASMVISGQTGVSGSFLYYKNYNFTNFDFSYINGQIIPAWIEAGPNPYGQGDLLVWLKLNGIGAESSITIYLNIFSTNDNLLGNGIGEAPTLSPEYAEYDNGASVFDFYDNFYGHSLNGNNWVYGGTGSIVVNNTVSLKTNNYIYIMTRNGFNPQSTICDVYARSGTINAPDVAFSMTVGNFNNSNGYFWLFNSYNKYSNGSYANGGYYIGNSNTNGFALGNIASISWQTNNNHVYITDYGYSDVTYGNQTFDSYPTPSVVYYGIGLQYKSNGYVNVTWFRVRAYPSNGVMPSVYFDIGLNVSISYPNNNLVTNNTAVYNFNSTSGSLQFSNQYFSFMLDPVFLIYLVSIVFVIFSIYMGVAVVRRRRNG